MELQPAPSDQSEAAAFHSPQKLFTIFSPNFHNKFSIKSCQTFCLNILSKSAGILTNVLKITTNYLHKTPTQLPPYDFLGKCCLSLFHKICQQKLPIYLEKTKPTRIDKKSQETFNLIFASRHFRTSQQSHHKFSPQRGVVLAKCHPNVFQKMIN